MFRWTSVFSCCIVVLCFQLGVFRMMVIFEYFLGHLYWLHSSDKLGSQWWYNSKCFRYFCSVLVLIGWHWRCISPSHWNRCWCNRQADVAQATGIRRGLSKLYESPLLNTVLSRTLAIQEEPFCNLYYYEYATLLNILLLWKKTTNIHDFKKCLLRQWFNFTSDKIKHIKLLSKHLLKMKNYTIRNC